VGECGSNDCYTDYVAQFTPAGHAGFRRLKPLFGTMPGFSRGGHRVAYVDDHQRLIGVSVRTRRRRILAREAHIAEPAWSPGGRRIVFVQAAPAGSWSITTIGVDGRGLRRLTDGDQPAWSPRGGIIAFARFLSTGSMLYTVAASGGPEHALGPGENPDWSPQGDALVFDHDLRIWFANPDGTHSRNLGAGSMPRFSPDGRQIAFIHDLDLYVMDRDGHHKHKLVDDFDLAYTDDSADDAPVTWLAWQPLLS
jgi:Tol biopolymer transport system component